MSAATVVALVGSAVLTAPLQLSADTVVALLPVVGLSAASTLALKSLIDGAFASAVDFEKRWMWQHLNYAAGRSLDLMQTADTSEFDQRSWMGIT